MKVLVRVVATCTLIWAMSTAAIAQVESLNLWNAGIGGYDTYRVPGIVTTKKGVLLAYCGARLHLEKGDWSETNILLRRSLDGGKTWEPSRQIAGTGAELTDNIIAIADRQTGAVNFLYQTNYSRVFVIQTTDDGKTFSRPTDITPVFDMFRPDYEWNVVAPGTGHGIQLKSGRLIASIWLANGKVNPNGTRAHAPSAVGIVYSDDHGKTWSRGPIVSRNSPEITNPGETRAVQLAGGKVMLNIRSGSAQHLRATTTSADGVNNWSPLQFDQTLFDPICDAGIIGVPASTGFPAMLIFSNPDSRDIAGTYKGLHRARQNMTIKVSTDDGATWTHQRMLDPGAAGYSDLTSLGDSVFVIYESGTLGGNEGKPAHLILAKFSKRWLLEGNAPERWNPPSSQ